MEEEESGNGRRVGKRERERKIVSCIGARCYPFSLSPSSLNANRGEIKKATGWPPANCPSQTWRTLRECSLREHNPRINPRKTSLSGFYEGRGKKATRTCVRVSPSRRANRLTSAFFRTSFFSSSFPSLPFSSRFFFLRISIMVERIFFAAPRCRVHAWGLALKNGPPKTTTRLWNSTAVQLNPRQTKNKLWPSLWLPFLPRFSRIL